MNGMVWLDGAILDAAAAKVSVFDHGLTVGDGVFETIKLIAGRPFALRRHIERLHRSALGLGLDVPLGEARLRDAIDDLLAAAPAGEVGRLRVTVRGGGAPPGSGRGGSGPRRGAAGARRR